MKNKNIIREFKEELKTLALEIKTNRKDFRKILSRIDKKYGPCAFWEHDYNTPRYKELAKKHSEKWEELRSVREVTFGDKYFDEYSLQRNSRKYRHMHIAYCELRGRTRDQIEKPREGNEPDEKLIQTIKDDLRTKAHAEETLCAMP